jgi:hypothetical protein
VNGTILQKEPWIIPRNHTKEPKPKANSKNCSNKNLTKNGLHPLISVAIYTKHLATALLSVKWFSRKLLKCAVAGIQLVISLILTLTLLPILRIMVKKGNLRIIEKNLCPWYRNKLRKF